ncbi:MAG: hypothetical protein ACLQBC_10875 [Syntrophales bacterium]
MVTKSKKKTKPMKKKDTKKSSPKNILLKPKVEILDPITMQNYGMDGTSHTEISFMRNIQYAPEIIRDADKAFNVSRLDDLKLEKKMTSYLREGSNQIRKMCHAIEAITAHTGMFVVHFLVRVGDILNHVESTLENKSHYMKWIRDNFEDRQIRYFQQSKQLSRMGVDATLYASAGKNRLLELDRLKKAENKTSISELMKDYPLPDSTQDMEGIVLKEHIDAIITLNRLHNAGIDFAEYDQAALLACYKRRALEIKEVEKIKKWIDGHPNKKRMMFEILIMDKMIFIKEDAAQSLMSQVSLNKILSDFIVYCEGINYSDKDSIAEYKKRINKDVLLRALDNMNRLSQIIIPKSKKKS